MANLLTQAQSDELLAIENLYRGVPAASPQGLINADVLMRVAKVLVPAVASIGVTTTVASALEHLGQRPWLYWATLVNILDLTATGYIFQVEANWEFWENVLIPSLANQPPERPMGLTDGLAVEMVKALKELPGLETDFAHEGVTLLEAVNQAPVVLMIEVIRNINANYQF